MSAERTAITKLLEERGNPPEDSRTGAQRVSIELDGYGNGPFRVAARPFEFVVDEPEHRGGQNQGPNPLQFFIAGAATCYLSHFMMMAIADGLTIEGLRMNARGRYSRVLKGGAFQTINYELKLKSPESAERIREVAERAEAACYAHNTLSGGGVEMITEVSVNDEHVTTLSVGGAASPAG